VKVRLCEKNKGKNKVLKDLQQNSPDIDVKIKKCIDMCSDCSKYMIAKVNDKEIVGKNREDLVAKVEKRLKTK
jgi:uncharacterized protein YuzB (UPF0349 family)